MKTLRLSAQQARLLSKPVAGNGGYQLLMRRLQRGLRIIVHVSDRDYERLQRYTQRYGEGGFQQRLMKIVRL